MELSTLHSRPLRVLHVVGQMERGGIETWLMHVLRGLDRNRIASDIIANIEEPGYYDDEARALGVSVMSCIHHTKPWLYAPNFLSVLRRAGPYDIVHSHVHHFSGITLSLARLAGVPVRIAHSHNTSSGNVDPSAMRHAYERVASALIRRYATAGFAVSAPAAAALFGRHWRRDPRWHLLHLGIDLAPYRNGRDTAHLRAALGIPLEAPLLGHVGRFAPQKNHDFLIDIFAQVVQRRPEARLLLVGDGELRATIAQKANDLGLSEQVIFAGARSDVPDLLRAMDVFILPSLYEGLGLVLIEAQTAGRPVVVSASVPEEGLILADSIDVLPLSEPAARWAEAVLDKFAYKSDPETAIEAMRESPFNIEKGRQELTRIYEELAT